MASESITIPLALLIQLEQAAGSYDSKNEIAARQAREILEGQNNAQSLRIDPVLATELQEIREELRELFLSITRDFAAELRTIASGDPATMVDELLSAARKLDRESIRFLPGA